MDRNKTLLHLAVLVCVSVFAPLSGNAQSYYYPAAFCVEQYVGDVPLMLTAGDGWVYNNDETNDAFVTCPTLRRSWDPNATNVCVEIDYVDGNNDSGTSGQISCTATSIAYHNGGFTYTSLGSSGDTAMLASTLRGNVSSSAYANTTSITIWCNLPDHDVGYSEIVSYDILQGSCP